MVEEQEKKKPGRKRQYDGSALVRCTGDELSELHKRAADVPMSLSRYLVECGLRSQNPPDPTEREMRERAIFELRKAGVNLNQIARKLNEGTDPATMRQLDAAAAAVQIASMTVAGEYGTNR